jgi:hypothetical protein
MVVVENEVDAGVGTDRLKFVASPVCKPCHEDPAHRTKRALKGHFFEPHQATDAVAYAGERDKSGDPVFTPPSE